jgi:Arc/MetJ-type ribon-helix-helix transcriptional regulator
MTKDMSKTLDEQRVENKLEELRSALIEGEESGVAGPFDFEAFIARKRGIVPPR